MEQHAEDLHQIIVALGAGPAEMFASSGGAVSAPRRREHAGGARATASRDPAQFGLTMPDDGSRDDPLPLKVFPSNHGGFLGGEFGQHGEPGEFAATLRRVLDGVGE